MRMNEEQTIDTSEYKYTLLVGEGAYFAQSIWSLMWEVFTHRCSHLIRDGRWVD